MFNNVIYFIVVLLFFSINYPDSAAENTFLSFLAMILATWLIFAAYCRSVFHRLYKRLELGEVDGGITAKYHRLIARCSVLAVFFFAVATYAFNLKYWLLLIPGFGRFTVLPGAVALCLFLFYLCTLWYFSHKAYRTIFGTEITRRGFVLANLRFNLPIILPWLLLSIVYDLMGLSPWSELHRFMDQLEGQLIFFACFLSLLMIFMPKIIQSWWGCRPIESSEKGRQLAAFLREKGLKYRHILKWPLFEGRMMTAGIMGIMPRYRYILVTDSLLQVLSLDELKAVLAHEMGHAKYFHLVFYIFFFVGFLALYSGLVEFFFYLFSAYPFPGKLSIGDDAQSVNLFYLLFSIPVLLAVVVYFRYIMGFFMRNFERQADLYATVIMGSPGPAVSSLEKIALLSGKSRDIPSWHHFSIRERVDCLWQTLKDPGIVKRHNRFVGVSLLIYVLCLVGLGYLLHFSPIKQNMVYLPIEKMLREELVRDPHNVALYLELATLNQYMGRYGKAIETYEKVIALKPDQGTALNNLAWLLVTCPREDLRDYGRGLALAKKAVALQRRAVFLDTLAEAYYVNGLIPEAVKVIEEAIANAEEDREYYEGQRRKFLSKARP